MFKKKKKSGKGYVAKKVSANAIGKKKIYTEEVVQPPPSP